MTVRDKRYMEMTPAELAGACAGLPAGLAAQVRRAASMGSVGRQDEVAAQVAKWRAQNGQAKP